MAPSLLALALLACAETTAWEPVVQCTFYDGSDHVETISTLVCVEGDSSDCSEEPWSQEYGPWTATVSLVGSDYELPSVTVAVQPTGLDGGMSVLYQLDGTPQNEFAGGHGFTGLHYVRHPDLDETFQFFCQVP